MGAREESPYPKVRRGGWRALRWGMLCTVTLGIPRRRVLVAALALALAIAPATAAGAADRPRYDVPTGFTRCPHATAWNGFFKWASVRRTTCRSATDFLRAYGRAAQQGPMPRRVRGFRCAIHYWRDGDGEIYASRHRCERGRVTIRFYGMA